MKKLLFVMLAALFAVSVVYAAGNASAAEPKAGGILRVAIEAEPPLMDPHLEQSNLVTSLVDLSFDFLWRWDKQFGGFEPRVAEKWTWVDATHFKVFVRKGVKFHNGRDVKAADVKYSIDRVKDPKTASPSAVFLEPIKQVVVNDDYTLTIELKYPWYGLQDKLARQVAIVPKEVVQKYGDLKTHPVGCGPFVFESWEPGLQMKFKKFDKYYIKGRPYLGGVVLRFMPEYNTAKNALISGEIDLINWPDTADIDSLKASKSLDLHYYNVNAIMYVCINTKSEPLDNPKVRKAIALATNREAYNDALYRGIGTLSWTPIPSTQPYYRKEWEYKRDINAAKKLLAEAGYPDGFDIKILALKGAEEIMGEVLQADLADIGINGEITIAEIPVALEAIFNKEDFDLGVLGDVISPDPDLFCSKYLIPNGQAAGATGRWDNARVKELVEKGRGTIDMKERIKIYQEIYNIAMDQVPMVWLAWPVRHPVSQKYVKDWFSWGDIRYDWANVWLDK
jgi:peptide/nickel transport system substrate-binding protein